MTAPQAAIPTADSEIRRVGEAGPSGGLAQSQRRSGAGPADELAFLALLSSNLGVPSAPTPAATIGRDQNAAAKGRTGLSATDRREPGAPGRAGASTEALTRSQADVLRTVGRGVSLSELAQAQLRGRTPGSYVRASDHAVEALRGDTTAGNDPGARAQPRERTHVESQSPDPLATQRQSVASSGRDATGNATGSIQTPTTPGSVAPASTHAHDASRHAAKGAGPPTPSGNRASAPSASATAPDAGTGAGNAASAPTKASPSTPTQSAPAVAPAASARAGTTAAPSKLATPKPTPTDRQGVINQANRALGLALRTKDGSVRFNLAPDHLGSLRVELTRSEQGGVSARFEAATQQAREMLEASIEQLRASLEARGLRVDRLDVRVAEAAGPERGGAPTPRPSGSEHPDAGDGAEHEAEPDAERGRHDGRDHQSGSGAWPDREQSVGTDAGASRNERWSRDDAVGGAEPPSGDRTRVAGAVVPGWMPWRDGQGVALFEVVV